MKRVFPAEGDAPEVRVYGPMRSPDQDDEGNWYDTWHYVAEAVADGQEHRLGYEHRVVLVSGVEPEGPWPERFREMARTVLINTMREEREGMSQPKRWVTSADIDNWVDHHPPANQIVVDAHQRVREATRTYLNALNGVLPEGPMKTTALNKGRDAMQAANSQIACVGNTDGIWQASVGEVLYGNWDKVEAKADESDKAEDQLASTLRSYHALADELDKLVSFLLRHYPNTRTVGSPDYHGDESAVDVAIRLLSAADSPAHRAAHENPRYADDAVGRLYDEGEQLARKIHETFKRLAPQYGEQVDGSWDDIPESIRATASATMREMLIERVFEAAVQASEAEGIELLANADWVRKVTDERLMAELVRRRKAGLALKMVADTGRPGTPAWAYGVDDSQLHTEVLRRSLNAGKVTLYAATPEGEELARQDHAVSPQGESARYTETKLGGLAKGGPVTSVAADPELPVAHISDDEYQALRKRADYPTVKNLNEVDPEDES